MSTKQTEAEAKQPTLDELDAIIEKSSKAMKRAAAENKLYVEARSAKDKAEMDKHRDGRRAHESAERERREARKQRASLYPEAVKADEKSKADERKAAEKAKADEKAQAKAKADEHATDLKEAAKAADEKAKQVAAEQKSGGNGSKRQAQPDPKPSESKGKGK